VSVQPLLIGGERRLEVQHGGKTKPPRVAAVRTRRAVARPFEPVDPQGLQVTLGEGAGRGDRLGISPLAVRRQCRVVAVEDGVGPRARRHPEGQKRQAEEAKGHAA